MALSAKTNREYTSELRKINSARNVYQTYQSNNAIFNAIEAITPKTKVASNDIRKFQVYNYELGLSDMEELLTESEKKDLPIGKANMLEIEGNIEAALNTTQKRLEILQNKLYEKEKKIKSASDKSGNLYFWGYICFSIISIAGAIFKIATK